MKKTKISNILKIGTGILIGAATTLFIAKKRVNEMRDDIEDLQDEIIDVRKKYQTIINKNIKFEKEFNLIKEDLKNKDRRLSFLEQKEMLTIESEKFKENFIQFFYDDMLDSINKGITKLNYGNIINFIERNAKIRKVFRTIDIDKARKTRNKIAHPKGEIDKEELVEAILTFQKYNFLLDKISSK